MNRNSSLLVVNAIFDGNRALYGGGLSDHDGSSVDVGQCTFFENTAQEAGNGAYFEDNEADNIDIYNSIFWNPSADCQVEMDKVSGDLGIVYTNMPNCPDAPGVLCNVNCLSEDPLFENPSGPPDISFRLDQGSPCIDAGNCALLPRDYTDLNENGDEDELLQWDLDEEPRCVGSADLGAYEMQ